MKKIAFIILLLFSSILFANAQTRQASASAALKPIGLEKTERTIDLISGLKIQITFNPRTENLMFTGYTKNNPLFIFEYIPLDNPAILEIGKSHKLDNLYVSMEYKILEVKDDKVTRIWFRVVSLTEKLPQEPWI